MIPPIPQEALQELVTERGVSEAELEALLMALEGQSTAAIATQLGISNIAVRKRLGEVYRKFNINGRGPGKLAELKHVLLTLHQSGPNQGGFAGDLHSLPGHIANRRRDWGDAPDISTFYGRTKELATLEQWIVKDRCRLVALLGMEGIGKTTLLVQLAKQIQDEFEYIFWRSLRPGPSVSEFLTNLSQLFPSQKKAEVPEDVNTRLSKLMESLRKHKCLLILDDFEQLLCTEELAGKYRLECEGYTELLRRVAEGNHNSCLVLIGSEKPAELALIEGERVRSLQITGAKEIGQGIFQEKRLFNPDQWSVLIERYGGHPLALKIVASTIRELFNGHVAEFLKNTLFLGDIRYLLDRHFYRLSESEKEIMYWLAIEGQPVAIASLKENILLPISQSDLLKNMASLDRRSLVEKHIERGNTLFALQPFILKYITDLFVSQVCEEILDLIKNQKLENLSVLRNHLLGKKPENENRAKNNQSLPILQRIKNELHPTFMRTGYEELLEIIKQIAAKLPDKSQLELGYASINIKTLLWELKDDMSP